MNEVLRYAPPLLYFLLGLVCAAMAFKTMTARKYLPFHEQAAGGPWDELDEPIKRVILSLLRLSGLGFLVTALLLMVGPLASVITGSRFFEFAVPAVGLVFCAGLFFVNYSLHAKTKVHTPWRGSLYAMIVIGVAITISALNLE